jgi:TolB-like protein
VTEEEKTKLRLEIAHVLFMDIVGYSKLLMDEQVEVLHELNEIVRKTEAVREAEADGKLILLPTGDGMVLVFTSSVEAPVECALQISQVLRAQPSLPLRMGIHSGTVQQVEDVNKRANIAGAGINIAQRVMDCGDAGHILISKRVADDLATSRRWQPYLHALDECEVKHGLRLSLVNLYAPQLGNPELPKKFQAAAVAAKPKKRGYRFVGWMALAAVLLAGLFVFSLVWRRADLLRWTHGTAPAVKPTAPPDSVAPAPERSVAVLPFDSYGADQQNAYFADGIQDEILTDLSKIAALKVIGRVSVLAYRAGGLRNSREIGLALGVSHLLEGSVQRQAGKVRVTAYLIDARSNTQMWADRYDRDLADIFGIQTEVAERIVGSLRGALSPGERAALRTAPTEDVQAFDLYLKAKELIDDFQEGDDWRNPLLEALRLLGAAIARDRGFALAYCLSARAHDDLYWFELDRTPVRLAQAQAAVAEALRLQPALGEAHLEQALLFYRGARDFPAALRELAIARAALPNDAQVFSVSSWIERRQGRWTEAVRDLEQSLSLDPRNPAVLTDATVLYDFLRQYAEENRIAAGAIQAVPASAVFFRMVQAQLQISCGQLPAARKILRQIPAAYDPSGATTFTRIQLALDERKFAEAASALDASKSDGFAGGTATILPRAWLQGLIARAAGQDGPAKTAFLAARVAVQADVQARPEDASARALLGQIDAGLGRKEDALAEGARAVKMLSTAADAIDGPEIEAMLARIEAWTGNQTSAVDRLARLSAQPCGPDYGELRFDPGWDVLRSDDRFQKLVAGLAPATLP